MLRIALVHDPAERLTESEAMLVDRLARDDRFQLSCRILGRRRTERLPAALRTMLGAERLLVGRRLKAYSTLSAERRIAALPTGSRAVDVAVAVGAEPQDASGALPAHGLWSLSLDCARTAAMQSMAGSRGATDLMSVEILCRDASAPQGRILAATGYNPKISAVLGASFVAEKAVLFLVSALARLAATGAAPSGPTAPIAAPRVGLAEYGAHFLQRSAGKLADRLRERRSRMPVAWQLAAGHGTVARFDPAASKDLSGSAFTMADPFLFAHDGRLFLFHEAQEADGGPARIDVGLLDGDRLTPLGTALKRETHLSFPFVFAHRGEIFMMPESQQANRLEVWRATDFPLGWELHATALEGQYPADSMLLEHGDGHWWLFTNLSDHHAFQEHSSELYLFSCDGPDLRRMTPHPQNPVVVGSAVARNAGAIVRQGGRLYRPSQMNVRGVYGYGLNVMEIEALDHRTYSERLVHRITPDFRAGCTGIHHATFAEGRFVVDWSHRVC